MADSVINTFDKGLHQDSSFILQPDGTYRNMKNGMLISYDGNHYVVEMSKGNSVFFELPQRFLEQNDSSATLLDTQPMAIGFSSFVDKLIVFSTNNEGNGNYGEIGEIVINRTENNFTASYLPFYHHRDLNFSKKNKIESFAFRENDNIERIYWTDNNNEPKVFDIANPIFTTYIPTNGIDITSTIPKKYMVLGGIIEYNGYWYGPSDITLAPAPATSFQVNGNIFESDMINNSYTVISGTPLVIEYFPITLLDWTPSRAMGNMTLDGYGTGSKNCGNHIYFYRLYSTSEGYSTSWSYASNPIHIGMANKPSAITGNDYNDFVGDGSVITLVNSGFSIKLSVSNIDLSFDTIELACLEYTQSETTPYKISIVNKVSITAETMIIEDNGTNNYGTITISDLTLFPASLLKVKTISTNKNYIVAGNLTERKEFNLDVSGISLSQFQYPIVSNYEDNTIINSTIDYPGPSSLVFNPSAGSITPNSRWLVTVGDLVTNTVTYQGTQYVKGDVIVGTAFSTGSTVITFTNNGQVRPCTTKNKYKNRVANKRTEDAVILSHKFWDYKCPTVANHNKGYWSDEKYRFGVLFYDKKGNPFYVKYLGDYTFLRASDKGGLMKQYPYSASTYINCLNPSGLNISGLDIPESIMNQISGFSIVRAERDSVIVTQGLLTQSQINSTFSLVMPIGVMAGFMPASCSNYNNGLCNVICPDYLLGHDFTSSPMGVEGRSIKEVDWMDPDAVLVTSDFHTTLARLYKGGNSDSLSPRTSPLLAFNGYYIRNFNENDSITDIDGSGNVFYNGFQNVAITYPYGGAYSGPDVLSVGCKKNLIKVNFKSYSSTTIDYNASGSSNFKILVNFINNKASNSLYGGTSDAALANTTYMTVGHFQSITSQVKIDTLNGTFASGEYAGENKYTFDNIEIFGGDCFTNLIDVGYGLWNQPWHTANNAMSYGLWFPCECNVNYNLRRGLKISNKDMYPLGTVGFDTPGGVLLEDFIYNNAYSSTNDLIKYPALPYKYKFTDLFQYRVRWAGEKYPGEINNTFRNFRIGDRRDLDGQRGQLNNLKTRDSRMFYWQDHSVGYVPILERQLVGGTALGDATALGVTGVIDRYDDIDTYFGNQHQHGLTETEYGFAWFDMRRRAFMVMGVGSKPEEMSMIKGLQVFFNNEFNEGNFGGTDKVYNINTNGVKEQPLLGYGIVGGYDPIFKMTYVTFKYEKHTSSSPNELIINKDFTLGYNHVLNAFVAFYDNCPAIWHNHNDLLLTANNPKNTKPYNASMPSTDYVVGDTIKVGNLEYICIQDTAIASYPGTLLPANWLAINKTNEVYLQTFGAEICKFYGKVWNHNIEVVVNAKSDMPVNPQNIQFKSIGPNWTDLTASTDDQTASDLNISTTNRNYRWIDKAWFSSIPIDKKKGRLTDYYVKISFTFKNYVSNPTVSKNIQRVSQWLKTYFVRKR